MKVAVIGAGDWGKNLVRTFHRLGVLVAVAEPNHVLREALAAQYPDLLLYGDYHPLLERDITALAIATPAHTHYQVAKEALLADKDVFVEKPITLSTAEAEELVTFAQERGRILMVGHLLLYQPAVQWIKGFLKAGSLGEVYSLHQERLNLGRARSVENVLWSFGVHDVAVLLYLVDHPPARVRATGQRVLQEGIEDDAYLHLKFPRGIQAHLHTSWMWPEKCRRLTVVGAKGMLAYDEADQSVTLHHKGIRPDLVNWDEGSEVVYKGHGEPLYLELKHFLARLNDRLPPLSDGPSGVEVVRVLEEAARLLNGGSD